MYCTGIMHQYITRHWVRKSQHMGTAFGILQGAKAMYMYITRYISWPWMACTQMQSCIPEWFNIWHVSQPKEGRYTIIKHTSQPYLQMLPEIIFWRSSFYYCCHTSVNIFNYWKWDSFTYTRKGTQQQKYRRQL